MQTLQPLVICSLKDAVPITASGIPPHTQLLRELTTMRNQNQDLIPAIDAARQRAVEDIIQVLEDRAIGAGTVTRDGLRDLLANELERVLGNVRRGDDAPEEQPQGQQEQAASQVFHWQGGIHRLPQDYQLPSGTVGAAFRCWMLPDTVNNLSALKHCSTRDFSNTNQKKRFSDLSKLMRMIQGQGELTRNPTIQQVDELVHAWEQKVQINPTVLKLVNSMNR